jgi:hypothetical protein
MPGDNSLQNAKIVIIHRSRSYTDRSKSIASCLQVAGYRVSVRKNGLLDLGDDEVLVLLGSANWYPVIWRQLASLPTSERPFSTMWHSEPLPPPDASGLPWSRLLLWEIRKILLQRAHASDI